MTSSSAEKRQRQPLIPVSSVFKNARSSLISGAHFELQRGLFRERERLRGRPWLLLLKRNEIEVDGSWYDRIELVDTFDREKEAVDAAAVGLQAAFQEDQHKRYGAEDWRLEAKGPEVKAMSISGPRESRLRSAFRYGYKLRRFGLHIRYGVIDIVRVNPERVVDDDLFDYLGAESEVIAYLCEKGRD